MVEPLTAGIIPHQVGSPYSNMVIYDLAGHHQYFSRHSACPEFIPINYCSRMCPQKPSVIVVCMHADPLTPQEVTRKLTLMYGMACANGHEEVVRMFLSAGAKVDLQSKVSSTSPAQGHVVTCTCTCTLM